MDKLWTAPERAPGAKPQGSVAIE